MTTNWIKCSEGLPPREKGTVGSIDVLICVKVKADSWNEECIKYFVAYYAYGGYFMGKWFATLPDWQFHQSFDTEDILCWAEFEAATNVI